VYRSKSETTEISFYVLMIFPPIYEETLIQGNHKSMKCQIERPQYSIGGVGINDEALRAS
jgi:hypothetical protein